MRDEKAMTIIHGIVGRLNVKGIKCRVEPEGRRFLFFVDGKPAKSEKPEILAEWVQGLEAGITFGSDGSVPLASGWSKAKTATE